jgi:small redox-active disulfide protein 2
MLAENVRKAIEEAGIDTEVEKIEDVKEIMKFNIMITPGLAIDGEVKSVGKVLSTEDIKKLLLN